MELWVRSQDKINLIKLNHIYVDVPLLNGSTAIIGRLSDETNRILGYYKTKERALEVLDEIYKLIEQGDIVSRPNYLYGSYHMPGVGYNKLEINGHNIFGNKGSIVYEMPNE